MPTDAQKSIRLLGIYDYQVFEFKKPGRKSKVKCVDIAPSIWFRYNFQTKKLQVRFLKGPYTEDTRKILYEMVRTIKPPLFNDSTWGWYNVELRSHAGK